jgi:hypothetical protein
MELRNQSNSDVSSVDSTNNNNNNNNNNNSFSNSTFSDGSQLYTYASDVSGHYSNPSYGILDFTVPNGWYGSERQWSGDKSNSLDLHPGTEDQYLDKLLNSPVDEIIPTMTLEPTTRGNCKWLNLFYLTYPVPLKQQQLGIQHQTCASLLNRIIATISGRLFNDSITERIYSSNGTQLHDPNNPFLSETLPTIKTIEATKKYESESSDKIYSLQLTLSKDLSFDYPNSEEIAIDLTRYTP